jgi:hypothetical protein
MDAVFVKENMRIMWVSEAGMVENIDQIIKEYKDSRKLQVKNIISSSVLILRVTLYKCDNSISYQTIFNSPSESALLDHLPLEKLQFAKNCVNSTSSITSKSRTS